MVVSHRLENSYLESVPSSVVGQKAAIQLASIFKPVLAHLFFHPNDWLISTAMMANSSTMTHLRWWAMLRSNALVSSSILVHPLVVQIQFHRPATIANFSTGSEPLFFQIPHLGRLPFFSEIIFGNSLLGPASVSNLPFTARTKLQLCVVGNGDNPPEAVIWSVSRCEHV